VHVLGRPLALAGRDEVPPCARTPTHKQSDLRRPFHPGQVNQGATKEEEKVGSDGTRESDRAADLPHRRSRGRSGTGAALRRRRRPPPGRSPTAAGSAATTPSPPSPPAAPSPPGPPTRLAPLEPPRRRAHPESLASSSSARPLRPNRIDGDGTRRLERSWC
jgi:hypothetical protein